MGVTQRLGDWLDERTGYRALLGEALDESVPGGARLRYVFGSVLTYLFMQQVVLGILLASYYSPSATDAWASTAYIQDQVTGGWFLRGLHHHGSSLMVIVLILHMAQVFLAGAYKRPREVNWWTGLAMGGLVLAFALTGYLLPWDQKGYWATQVATGIMGGVPGGEPLQALVQGGTEYGNLTITRFYALHVFVLPLGLTALLGLHLFLFRKHGVTPPAKLSEAELVNKTQPFWPNQLFLDVLAMFVTGLALVLITVQTHGAELFAPADPASNFVARPEWYFLFLFQLLKYFDGPLTIVATVLIPGAVATFLMLLPFVDRKPERALRKRGSVVAAMGLLMAGVVALTVIAISHDANDDKFQKALAQAHEQAERARDLAKKGVPPAGGVAVFENDPAFKAKRSFEEHCATCHTIDGVAKGGEEAPTLVDFSSREWLAGAVRRPRSVEYFGGTKGHETMEAYSAEDLSDADLDAVVEYLIELRGDPSIRFDAKLAARGKALWEGDLDCSGCHEVEAGVDGGDAPVFGGRGTVAWVERVIRDASQKDLYGDASLMPKFEDKLDDEEIEALAKLVVGRAAPSEAPDGEATASSP